MIFLKKISSPRAKKILSAKNFFVESQSVDSRRILIFTLAKEIFAESTRLSSRQRILLSAKSRFPVVNPTYSP
jgi:hypothetical protein